jgi:hypothetical protein
MIRNPRWLIAPYLLNIAILVPVCIGMATAPGQGFVMQDAVANSDGLRLLVFSLWLAILLALLAGLRWPAALAPVLLIQIVYKTVWLAAFILPVASAGQPVPWGVAGTFAFIVLTYPLALGLAMQRAPAR